MRESSLIILSVLIVQAYAAPQFISFADGKLGVHFAGYHAGVGLGGLAGKDGTGGGLFAEAGTPFGPAAKAGLGGSVDGGSGPAGGLYAGATAGGNTHAAAGLGGAVGAGKAVGGGFSAAQSGGHYASSHLGGESGVSGSSGFSISAHKSIGVPTTVIKETEVSVIPVKNVKTVQEEIHGEANIDAVNEIAPAVNAGGHANVNVHSFSDYVKEVSKWNGPRYSTRNNPHVQDIMSTLFRIPQKWYKPLRLAYSQNNYNHQVHAGHPPPPPPPPPVIVHKVKVHVPPPPPPPQVSVHKHKPHRHHLHKTAYVSGYVSAGGEVAAPESKTVIVKTVQPIERRVDIAAEAGAAINGQHGGSGNVVTYSKEVVVGNNGKPNTFFQDIFNIPISTLKAVSGFLSNTASNTNVSIQKSATIQTDSDPIASKHVPLSSSSTSSDARISVQTPSASKFIDGIFSIPINTLTAVNTFLENNVGARKRIQVTAEGSGEPTRVRLGPHARRRANKQAVLLQESAETKPQETQ